MIYLVLSFGGLCWYKTNWYPYGGVHNIKIRDYMDLLQVVQTLVALAYKQLSRLDAPSCGLLMNFMLNTTYIAGFMTMYKLVSNKVKLKYSL